MLSESATSVNLSLSGSTILVSLDLGSEAVSRQWDS